MDTVAELEGAADGGVRIEGQKHVPDEKFESAALDGNARDGHFLDIHGGITAGRMEACGDAYGPLAIEQLGHQPTGRGALRAPQFEEIDGGAAGGQPKGF